MNATESVRGVVRGLHGEAMTKVVAVAAGEAFGAYVDTRRESLTYGAAVTVPLHAGTQVGVPNGVCNGCQATSELTQYLYCSNAQWQPGMTGSP